MLEVHADKEKLVWMIGTSKFKTTFKDLAAAVQLSYHGMKQGKLVSHLPKLRADEAACFRYLETTEYGH